MPVVINERCIPATFEEAKEAYKNGKDVVLSIDGEKGIPISKKYRSQHMNIDDWSIMMEATFYISSYPCQCIQKGYPIVKGNDSRVFELCPVCKGTISIRDKDY